MAEFALGLTKMAMKETVSRVKLAMEEEAKQRVRVQDDLVFITGEFEMMQSFLSSSSAGERASKNQVVRTWVRQLRDLAFDVEDCVEFVVHLDKASRWDWLQRLASSVLVCVARPPLPLDVAVADIKRLKARVEDVSQRNSRYNLMGGDDSPADVDHEHQVLVTRGRGTSAAATFHTLREVWESNGKLFQPILDLKTLIACHGDDLKVISLWTAPEDGGEDAADGELGWVTTMRKAYYDPEICSEFKNRAWVKELAHPFNPVELLNNLLTQFRCHHDDFDGDRADPRLSELMSQLGQHRYLIIIEQEFTSIADWDAIRMYLPDRNNGSRVVVSTKHLGIALACTGERYQVSQILRFSHDRGHYAFFPEGCGHRIGIGELFWQARHIGMGAISVLWDTYDEYAQLKEQLYRDDEQNIRVPDGVEFERSYLHDAAPFADIQFEVTNLATGLLFRTYAEHVIDHELIQKVMNMSSEETIERCRKHLCEQDWLICIDNLQSCRDWDLIKRNLLPESTRGCIVVITGKQNVATHCVDHESRVLNVKDLLKGHGDGGGKKKEEVTYQLDKLVGREYAFSWMYCNVKCVWGIPGVGKSASIREDYYYHKLNIPLYGMYGWADVPHPFNLRDICRQLLLDFYSDDVEAKEAAAIGIIQGQDPIQWYSKLLHENKFLLVLDGLRSKHDWDLIKAALLSQPITGCTVVITREESIAAHCGREEDNIIVNIKGLRDDLALEVFAKVALDGKQLSPDEADILNLIISKCGGLPGVITALGGECRREGPLDIGLLEDINADFMGILERAPCLRSLFCWMQSYFDACPDELKPCIFYMSVFPADRSIRRRRLLRRWIAEGYSSHCGGGCGAAAEEMAEKLLLQLLNLSILYNEHQTSTIKRCRVNGFFREYIKSRPMEDNLVFELEGSCSPSSQLRGQHLTISSSWDREEIVFNNIDLSRLRSLTVFGAWKPFLASEKMKLLRVLDLEGTNTSDGTSTVTDGVLEEISKLLHRLKFLSLRGCQQITRLPDSLGDMKQLQTLDVRYTSIIELPSSIITKLHKVEYIRAGTSNDTSLLLQTKKPPTLPPSPKAQPTPPPTPPQEQSHGGTRTFLPPTTPASSVVQVASTKSSGRYTTRARDLVSCSLWQSKKQLDQHRRHRLSVNGGGVEVSLAAAKEIGWLTEMHTLGVVNIAGGKPGAFLFLEELTKLTQLRKLGLSGINRHNWRKLCDAISGNLHHLESLSLQLMLLEEDVGKYQFACFDEMCEPSKTIKSLKVIYTTTGVRAADAARIGPVWIKKLPNLVRFVHELTVSSQEDVRIFTEQATWRVGGLRLRVKPVEGDVRFAYLDDLMLLDSLRIECSSTSSHSKVTFVGEMNFEVEAISVHCCCISSAGTSPMSSSSCNLEIVGFVRVSGLKVVTVTGTYADGLKRHLRGEIDGRPIQLL
ncbi:hypothetical protein ACQ4PT_007654 [Festuca glaucescens]